MAEERGVRRSGRGAGDNRSRFAGEMFDLARDANLVADMASVTVFASAEPASVARRAWVGWFAAVSGGRGHKCTVHATRPLFTPLKSENGKAATENMSMESCCCRQVPRRVG